MIRCPPLSSLSATIFPYTTLFRSPRVEHLTAGSLGQVRELVGLGLADEDRVRGNRSHLGGLVAQQTQERPVRDAGGVVAVRHDDDARGEVGRSEEHTSELQSLMRNSYAVYCLKKKKYNKDNK